MKTAGMETQSMKKPKGEYAIQTVINAMRLLEEFRDAEELGVTELSRRLELHKNNVFRLLATLEQRGYIEQSPHSERYRLGIRSLELGQSYARSNRMLRRARQILENLASEAHESAHLAVLRELEVVHLDGELADQMGLAGLRIGRRLPAHCSALGKVLLGCSAEAIRESYDRDVIGESELARRTRETIVDRHKFFEHLRTVAVQGFAIDVEECEVGMCCAAAPVFDATGQVVAALSVSGPVFRLDDETLLRRIVPMVTASAERLSHDLGYAT